MKIALASAPVMNRNIDYNLQAMVDYMKACSGKAELILFGETALQGFDCLCWDYEKDKLMAVTLTDMIIQRVCDAARENRIAVSFGFIERDLDTLYSSQIFIGADGEIMNVFHRVSVGWKEYTKTDTHYCEGECFEKFQYGGKQFATGLCGDLWTDGRPNEMKALNADVVLWPVWCDYNPEEWNKSIKYEYAGQAALCGKEVLLVNPYCADSGIKECAAGACVHFQNGKIRDEHPAGNTGVLIIDVK